MDLFFRPLEKFLFASPSFDTLDVLLQQATSQRDQSPVNAITTLLLNRKLFFKALETFLPHELTLSDGMTLFRDNVTPSTGLLVSFFSLNGREYVKTTLGTTIQTVVRKPFSLNFYDASLSVPKQLKKLFRVVEKVLTRLFSSNLPKEISTMISFLMKTIDEPLKQKNINASEMIIAALFLHLICPAFIDPRQFGIHCGEISMEARQLLTWVTKIVQKIVCGTDFPQIEEQHIQSINSFIAQKREPFQQFIAETMRKNVSSDPSLSLPLCTLNLDERTEFSLWKTIYRYIKRKNAVFRTAVERLSSERSFECVNELQSMIETIESRRMIIHTLGGEEDFFSDPMWAEEVFAESHNFLSTERKVSSSGVSLPLLVIDREAASDILRRKKNRSSPSILSTSSSSSSFTEDLTTFSFDSSTSSSSSAPPSASVSPRPRSPSSSSTEEKETSTSTNLSSSPSRHVSKPLLKTRSSSPSDKKKSDKKSSRSLAFTGLYHR